jgi:hypothetical protein
MAMVTGCADHATPFYPQELAQTSPTSGGRLGEAMKFLFLWTPKIH